MRSAAISMLSRRMARIFGWFATIGIVVLSLIPGEYRPQSGAPGEFEHFLAYMLAAGLLGLGYPERTGRVRLCCFLICLSGLLEVVQLWVPGRSGALIGFAASTLGATLGMFGLIIMNLSLPSTDS